MFEIKWINMFEIKCILSSFPFPQFRVLSPIPFRNVGIPFPCFIPTQMLQSAELGRSSQWCLIILRKKRRKLSAISGRIYSFDL
jgi:hypothetical protein